MIVKCNKIISPTTGEDLDEQSTWLIKDNEYLVLALSFSNNGGINIFIQTHHYDEPGFFSANGFEFVSQKIPSNWINIAYEYDEVITNFILPKSWSYGEFFDELEAQNTNAIALYNQEVKNMYIEETQL